MSSHRVLNNLDCVQNVATFAFHSYACTSQFESIYCVLALFRCRAMHRAMHVPSIRVRSKRNASSMLAMCIVYVCVCVALSCRLYLASHRGVYCCVQYRHRTHYVLYFYTRMFFFFFYFLLLFVKAIDWPRWRASCMLCVVCVWCEDRRHHTRHDTATA